MRYILILFMLIGTSNAFAQTDANDTKSDSAESDASDDVITLNPIVVEAKEAQKHPHRTLFGELLRKTTGNAGDPIRGIARLPSVGTINDFFGVLSVRGGAPEDNLYYFDRLPLGYPYHLLGIVSVVSSEVIGKVDVHPGGFGAQFGADSQAVIDIHSVPKKARALGKFDSMLGWLDGTLKPSFIYTETFLSGTFSLKNDVLGDTTGNEIPEKPARTDQEYLENKALAGQGYWYAFGRISHLEPFFQLASSLVDLEDLVRQVPSFWSYQLKGVYKLNRNHGIVLNAVTAYDASELRLGSREVHDSDLQGPLSSENPFDVQGIHLYSRLLPQFRSILSLTRSFTENEIAFGEGYYYRTAASVYAVRNDFTYTTSSEDTHIGFGYLLSNTPSTVTSQGARRPDEGTQIMSFEFDTTLRQSMSLKRKISVASRGTFKRDSPYFLLIFWELLESGRATLISQITYPCSRVGNSALAFRGKRSYISAMVATHKIRD